MYDKARTTDDDSASEKANNVSSAGMKHVVLGSQRTYGSAMRRTPFGRSSKPTAFVTMRIAILNADECQLR